MILKSTRNGNLLACPSPLTARAHWVLADIWCKNAYRCQAQTCTICKWSPEESGGKVSSSCESWAPGRPNWPIGGGQLASRGPHRACNEPKFPRRPRITCFLLGILLLASLTRLTSVRRPHLADPPNPPSQIGRRLTITAD